jgi:hypothetical protein
MGYLAVDSVPDFVAELIRAGNEVDRLRANEVRSLIFRAIATVRELREEVGIPGSGTPEDAVVGLHAIAVDAERRTPREWARALLEAADMVRTLRIVVDSGVEIALTPSC